MWTYNSVFYQIYTLNFCGAPRDNLSDWVLWCSSAQ